MYAPRYNGNFLLLTARNVSAGGSCHLSIRLTSKKHDGDNVNGTWAHLSEVTSTTKLRTVPFNMTARYHVLT